MVNNFMGFEYVWFFGIIENRNDPLKIGRCQVRIFAWNDASKSTLPTEQLLWSQLTLPLNSNDVKPPPEGTMVHGFFMDGKKAQHPIITSWVPGIPDTAPADPSQGFTDPRNNTQLQSSPRPPQTITYQTNGSGVTITEASNANRNPNNLNQPMTNPLARNENLNGSPITQRNNSLIENVNIASGTSNPSNETWSEPKSPYAAQYPYNSVTSSESGHIFEMDDTFGAERIHMFHRSGTFFEMQPNGTKVSKTTKDNYAIVLGNENIAILGNENKNVQGNENEIIQGNHNQNVSGSKNVSITGAKNLQINGSFSETVEGSKTETIQGSKTLSISGNFDITVSGGTLTINSEEVIINGDLIVNGSLTTTEEIKGIDINLTQHTHVAQGQFAVTTPPVSGS